MLICESRALLKSSCDKKRNTCTCTLATRESHLSAIALVDQGSAQDSAQDYLEVVKLGSDKHTYNIFQSNNQQKCIVVVWSLNDKDH